MERPHALLDNEYRDQLKQEQQFAQQILFLADQAFCDRRRVSLAGGRFNQAALVESISLRIRFPQAAE